MAIRRKDDVIAEREARRPKGVPSIPRPVVKTGPVADKVIETVPFELRRREACPTCGQKFRVPKSNAERQAKHRARKKANE